MTLALWQGIATRKPPFEITVISRPYPTSMSVFVEPRHGDILRGAIVRLGQEYVIVEGETLSEAERSSLDLWLASREIFQPREAIARLLPST